MTARTIHMCIDVRGLLLKSDRHLEGWLSDDAGNLLSPRDARLALMGELLKGHEVIPASGACEGFDYKTGCPGHEKDEELVSR